MTSTACSTSADPWARRQELVASLAAQRLWLDWAAGHAEPGPHEGHHDSGMDAERTGYSANCVRLSPVRGRCCLQGDLRARGSSAPLRRWGLERGPRE